MTFDRPHLDLRNHSPSGASAAQVGAGRFGTGSERDLVHERLHDYLQLVDRKLTGSLKGASLVLAGVAEEMAAYRSVRNIRVSWLQIRRVPSISLWGELGEGAAHRMLYIVDGHSD